MQLRILVLFRLLFAVRQLSLTYVLTVKGCSNSKIYIQIHRGVKAQVKENQVFIPGAVLKFNYVVIFYMFLCHRVLNFCKACDVPIYNLSIFCLFDCFAFILKLKVVNNASDKSYSQTSPVFIKLFVCSYIFHLNC